MDQLQPNLNFSCEADQSQESAGYLYIYLRISTIDVYTVLCSTLVVSLSMLATSLISRQYAFCLEQQALQC